MLQKTSFADGSTGQDTSSLSPSDIFDVFKRRWPYFVIPSLLILSIGSVIVALWPPIYQAEGKVLVESQQIPTELVRSTVSSLASERIQVIEQRIMTRDNLLAIASKYRIFVGWRQRFSGTEIVDFMRERTVIKPLELRVPTRQTTRQTLAFTIGFQHEQPEVATRVANELVTMILNEDVRTRTNFASETTRFLERESKKIETELSTIEIKISEMKRRDLLGLPRRDIPPGEAQLATLKTELAQKSGVYSDSHPDIKGLKQRIAALEKAIGPVPKEREPELGLDALERQQDTLQKDLQINNQKLSAARMGESLERGQQSERLEVIEQPSQPQKPVAPNKPKLFFMVFALAGGAGGALVLVLELFDGTIRRKADLLKIIDGDLLVSIPYIATNAELLKQKRHFRWGVVSAVVIALAVLAVAAIMLPMDEITSRITARFG